MAKILSLRDLQSPTFEERRRDRAIVDARAKAAARLEAYKARELFASDTTIGEMSATGTKLICRLEES